MTYFETWKIVCISIICALGMFYAMPNLVSAEARQEMQKTLPSWFPNQSVNLGLDLQGGSHLLFRVEMAPVIKERFESMVDAARKELREKKIGYTELKVIEKGISFKLRDLEKDRKEAYKIASNLEQDGLDVLIDDETSVISSRFGLAAETLLRKKIVGQSIEVVRRRIDEMGTREPVIQRQGVDRILLQLPGVDNPEKIKEILGKTAKMSFHLVDINAGLSSKAPVGSVVKEMADGTGAIVIRKRSVLTGDMLVDSRPSFSENRPVVSFKFDAKGARKFCQVTRKNSGKPFAILLDDKVISAPRINEAICGGQGIITGNFSVEEASELSLLLRAGALPADLTVIEERTVGPSLGADSVAAGKMASMIGMALVLIFMVISYRLFGLFANIALLLNMAFIFAILSVLQATLTLPGIAGIVLTIGMAVDANVLIFERIREELTSGRSITSSIDTGYRQAMSTIIDANITTLIAAFLLYSFGTGPIKGFSVTLGVGIMTSMFSAVVLTRLFIVLWLTKNRSKKELPL